MGVHSGHDGPDNETLIFLTSDIDFGNYYTLFTR